MPLPAGLDRADGTVAGYGTPTPAGAVVVSTPDGQDTFDAIPIEEMADSPEFERAEQATLTHRYTMGYEKAVNESQFLGRGTVRQDTYGNFWKVLNCSVRRIKPPGTAMLTVTEESISFDSPPDQFQIVPVELGINIIKHPRYFYAFLGEGYGSLTEKLNQHVIRVLQDYFENTTYAYRSAIEAMLYGSIGQLNTTGSVNAPFPDYLSLWRSAMSANTLRGTDLAKYAALEIIQKWWRGEETPYVVGYQITWSQFFFRPPFLNPGGYEEDPVEANPQLPDYFWSNASDQFGIGGIGGIPGSTIYDWITYWNPQCYATDGQREGPLSISWLRKADEIDYERTWFKVTRTWIGSPVGFWDRDLYNSGNRPTLPQHFQQYNA